MPFEHWNNVHVNMEYVLSSSCSVLLYDAEPVGFCGSHDCRSNLLGDFMRVPQETFGNIKNVYIMLFRDDECVPLVYGSNIHKSHNLIVFVDHACRGFFADYFAENAVITQGCSQPFRSIQQRCTVV